MGKKKNAAAPKQPDPVVAQQDANAAKQKKKKKKKPAASSDAVVKVQADSPSGPFDTLVDWALFCVRCYVMYFICKQAYTIRLDAVKTFGVEIHEFDPWFNFRATEYLERNGASAFMSWFDTESWSPIGRPVGTTIYPGMQFTAVAMYRVAQFLKAYNPMFDVSLKFICVYIPAWFGSIASLLTCFLASEITGSSNAGVVAAAVMAIIPAHLMRSVAGGFDNESVAVTALCLTFYTWIRSQRNEKSAVPWGILCGLSYFNMVAAWGGYVFVLNMIGIHAGLLVVFGCFDAKLYRAYSLFYVIGTALALQIPIVGMNPLRSAEQLGPMAVFLGMQVLSFASYVAKKRKLTSSQIWRITYLCSIVVVAVLAVLGKHLIDSGKIWEFSVRVKSLFIPHTKTGNPLVDSVAEHQSTPSSFYDTYLHHTYYISPFGILFCLLKPSANKVFLISYFLICFYFSQKMVRLVLLLAPAVSVAVGVAVAVPFDWGVTKLFRTPVTCKNVFLKIIGLLFMIVVATAIFGDLPVRKKPLKVRYSGYHLADVPLGGGKPIPVGIPEINFDVPRIFWKKLVRLAKQKPKSLIRKKDRWTEFSEHCHMMAEQLSSPQIMLQGQNRDGSKVIIDDFREAYWWLRDNTPKKSRVMSWWDYGYQINGIANRTTIADGNTWNHEHIALLGRCLVSNEKNSWNLVRHLADYVLVWTTRYAGMYGDDLAKSPHMARISGSVYSDIDPSKFWMDQSGNATPMMKESLLYKLHFYRLDPSKNIKLKHYEEVYTTKHRMVRIYKVLKVHQKSKKHPFGSYPPALHKTLKKAKDFSEVARLTRLRANKFD